MINKNKIFIERSDKSLYKPSARIWGLNESWVAFCIVELSFHILLYPKAKIEKLKIYYREIINKRRINIKHDGDEEEMLNIARLIADTVFIQIGMVDLKIGAYITVQFFTLKEEN